MEVKLKGGCGFEVRPSFTLSTVLNVKEASVHRTRRFLSKTRDFGRNRDII